MNNCLVVECLFNVTFLLHRSSIDERLIIYIYMWLPFNDRGVKKPKHHNPFFCMVCLKGIESLVSRDLKNKTNKF